MLALKRFALGAGGEGCGGVADFEGGQFAVGKVRQKGELDTKEVIAFGMFATKMHVGLGVRIGNARQTTL